MHGRRRDEGYRFQGCAASLVDGESDGCGSYAVGKIDNGVYVNIAECVVERLQLATQPFCHLRDGSTTFGAAFAGQALGTFGGVTRFEQILGHVISLISASRKVGSNSITPPRTRMHILPRFCQLVFR